MKKGSIAKEKILKTSIKLFSRHGFDATSFQLIADKSKVSSTAPLYYFKTKQDLIDEAIKMILNHNSTLLSTMMLPTDSANERIKKHFKFNLEWARQYRDEAQVILLVYYLSSFDKKWSQKYSVILNAARAKIVEILYAGLREKLFQFDMSPELMGEILHDSLLGGIVNAVAIHHSDNSSFDCLSNKWEQLIKKLLMVQ